MKNGVSMNSKIYVSLRQCRISDKLVLYRGSDWGKRLSDGERLVAIGGAIGVGGDWGQPLNIKYTFQPAARIGLNTDAAACIKLRRFQERSKTSLDI